MTRCATFWRPSAIARLQRRRRADAGVPSAVATAVLVGLLVGACGFGGPEASQSRDPRGLALAAAQAIATAPGVAYSLSISTNFGGGGGRGGTDSEGLIDFETRRFSGTADAGAPGGFMLLFGGPTHGAVIIADRVFVKTEAGPWEAQPPAQSTMLDPFIDRAGLSRAVATAFAASRINPDVRAAPCGTETCRVVGLVLPPAALVGLSSYAFGDFAQELPPDLGPVAVDLYLDGSGFPVRMETRLTAGSAVTTVTLRLARLDPAPAIAPPIP
jgi:hypothetical protein